MSQQIPPAALPEDQWSDADTTFATPLKRLSKSKLLAYVKALDPELLTPLPGTKRPPSMALIVSRAVALNRLKKTPPGTCSSPECSDTATSPAGLCSLCEAKDNLLDKQLRRNADSPPKDADALPPPAPTPSCKSCTQPLPSLSANFCAQCGASQHHASPTGSLITCGHCGVPGHQPNAKICFDCGSPLCTKKLRPDPGQSLSLLSHHLDLLRGNPDNQDATPNACTSGVGNLDPDVENAVKFGLFIQLSFFVLRFEDRASRLAKSLKNTFHLASALRSSRFSGQYKAPPVKASIPASTPINSVHELLQALQRLRDVRAAFFPHVATADRFFVELIQQYATKKNFNVTHCVECIDDHFERAAASAQDPAFPLLPEPGSGFSQADLAMMWSAPVPAAYNPTQHNRQARQPPPSSDPPPLAAGESRTLGHFCFVKKLCFRYNKDGSCTFPNCSNPHHCPCGAKDHGHFQCKSPMFSPDQIQSKKRKDGPYSQ